MKKNTALIIFLTFIVTSCMYFAAYVFVPSVSTVLDAVTEFITPDFLGGGSLGGELNSIKGIIDNNYIEKPDNEALKNMALKGYVAGLGDVYSEYYTKDEYEALSSDLSGNYKGIGVEVTIDDDNLITLLAVFDDAPAAKAGLMAGDKITKVNDTIVNGDNYNEAINMIRGVGEYGKNDTMTLTIKRGDNTFEAKVTREHVTNQTVKTEMLENNIGYIEVSQFAEETDEDFRIGVNSLITDGAKSLIIDLRNNPGGMLTTVVDMADFLLPEGNILTIKGRNTEPQEYLSGKEHVDIPMCVLINGNSASASEVLAGALHDHKKAVLVGETSYGKGVVQSIFDLSNGGALKITIAKYYTPNGTCIDTTGIEPDHVVEMELTKNLSLYEKSEDIQLLKAIEIMNK